jgi:hypothetical protein
MYIGRHGRLLYWNPGPRSFEAEYFLAVIVKK